ncbi:MAG: hypothetical protein D6722_17655 [Bacteroidetes bacterium]|nr:MAG: hypothetical protein D6722_17655 [Bacteroidota bacterium]
MKTLLIFLLVLFPGLAAGQGLPFMEARVLDNCPEGLPALPQPDTLPEWVNKSEVAMAMMRGDGFAFCRAAGICGATYIRFLIDAQGAYVCHRVTREDHPIYTGVYLDLVPIMRFAPGKQAGAPAAGWTEELKLRVPCGIN